MADSRRLESTAEFLQSSIELLESAERSVSLLSYCLEPRVYNNVEFCDALRGFLLRNRYSHIRVLVHSPDKALGTTRFIELCRRLSSFVELRMLSEQDQDCQEEHLIVDKQGYLYRAFPDDLYSIYDPEDPQTTVSRLREFNEMWNMAPPASPMRGLNI